jgi:hypothetical protein
MIFIDTRISSAFTFVHHAEEMEQVSYRSRRIYNIYYTNESGESSERLFYLYAKKPGWTIALDRLEKILEERNITGKIFVNNLECTSLLLKNAYPVIVDDIRSNEAHNIATFSRKRYFRDILKPVLSRTGIYRTISDKITNDPGL